MAKHIGLIGGIGPAATEFYYKALVRLYAAANQRLHLTIVNADAREMVSNMEAGNATAQAEIFAHYVDQLKAGGCEAVAVTSMGGHFCIRELESIAKLPVISAVPALNGYFSRRGVSRVGVLGTRAVMESKLYGINSVEVLAPSYEDLELVHSTYCAIAVAGAANVDEKRYLKSAGGKLHKHGAELVVLGGTDLFLAFGDEEPGYPIADSALIHAEAIARVAMQA